MSLRGLHIDFVSAGNMHGDFVYVNAELTQSSKSHGDSTRGSVWQASKQAQLSSAPENYMHGQSRDTDVVKRTEPIHADTCASAALPSSHIHATRADPEASDSCEDVVIFPGRKSNWTKHTQDHHGPQNLQIRPVQTSAGIDSNVKVSRSSFDIESMNGPPNKHKPQSRQPDPSQYLAELSDHANDDSIIEEALADYIANVEADANNSEEESGYPQTSNVHVSSGQTPRADRMLSSKAETASAVSRKNVGYLAPYGGRDEGTFGPFDGLSSEHESHHSLDTVDQAARDLQDFFVDMNHDQQTFRSHAANMTDERLAHRLAKQEELGLGGDELLLLDGAESDLSELNMEQLDYEAERYTQKQRRIKEARSSRLLGYESEGDTYGGFDILDRDRPSIQLKSKSKMLFTGTSDDELEDSLRLAWHNDKLKKKAQKKEREAIRNQGLLTKGKPKLAVKYSDGITIDQVKDELKKFLESGESR